MLDLAALVDLEWSLRDGPGSVADEALDARARAAAQRVAEAHGVPAEQVRARTDADRDLRQQLALAWLDVLRARHPDLPGLGIERGIGVAAWLLSGLGLLLGVGSATALLAYDGSRPVNVLPFFGFLCLGQIALLLLMLWFVLRAQRDGAAPGAPHRAVAWLAARFFGARGQQTVDALRSVRSRRSLYVDVERWTLFAVAQRFGVGFNVGAIAATALTVAFSDLVFCWSTTLALEPHTVHTVARAVATPWLWLPSAVPTLAVVEASQWARMPGTFVGGTTEAEATRLAAQWWQFLLAGVVVWGLLPRLTALWWGERRRRKALAGAGCDHAGYQELFDRMLPRGTIWHGPAATDVVGEPPRAGRQPATPHAPAAAGAAVWIVVWGTLDETRDAVRDVVTRRFGADVRDVLAVGGADLAQDRAALTSLGDAHASRVCLVAAAGQQPTADVLDFCRSLRTAIGAARPIVVGLLDLRPGGSAHDAEPDERAVWRRALGALDDPHVWVETLVDAEDNA